ncbi:MAG: Asp-tRNA(Asn)/Glu-tRNA(Gln) amidotransferase subunit GatA [Clostridia bacterium]|nr:Asp-tRNA(Asn)/Glu-tRNA(Gln) amidotransferase subunit GatA [Clostridia bacterium]
MNELVFRTLAQHYESLCRREYSSRELTEAYLQQIKETNEELNAYVTVCAENALKTAEECDNNRKSLERVPCLYGIPYALKDNICTKGVRTTCASKMLADYVSPYDAFVCQKLNAAGAILLGKTNMDEFAMGSTTENSYFGRTKNPLDKERVAGGSSGGSAAAVAGNGAVFALGSDTGGSVRQPSAFCGVVGMKPTYGTVSRYGLVAFASSLEQIGPITKTAMDNAMVLSSIVGRDTHDSTSVSAELDYVNCQIKNGVKGLKIGVCREMLGEGISADVASALEKAIETYRELGAEIVSVSIPSVKYALSAYYVISSAEASSNLARFDGVRYGYRAEKYESIEELYVKSRTEGFGSEVKRRIMLGTFALSEGYYDAYYKKALRVRNLLADEFDKAFNLCDMIIAPTAPTTAYKAGQNTDSVQLYRGDICTVPANLAGLPAISVPCGSGEDGLPIGMQLIGDRFAEGKLYRAAYAFEKTRGCKK